MTTNEVQTLRGEISHRLLKNEILLRLILPDDQQVLRRRGCVEERAQLLSRWLASQDSVTPNFEAAARYWVNSTADRRIEQLVGGVKQWTKYRCTTEFDAAWLSVSKALTAVGEFFARRSEWAARDSDARSKEALSLWFDLILIHDFIRSLDENDPDFARFMR